MYLYPPYYHIVSFSVGWVRVTDGFKVRFDQLGVFIIDAVLKVIEDSPVSTEIIFILKQH